MRLLIVTNTYPPGDITGVGALVHELARQLAGDGHQVTVVTRRAAADDPWARPTGGGRLAFPLRAARAFLRAPAVDLVHLHESDGVGVALLLRLLRALGRRRGAARLVATLQVSYRRERRAVRTLRLDGGVLARPTAAERRFALLRAPLLAVLGRLTARLADAVVAPSEVTAGELVADYGAREVTVIPNGVATAAAASARDDDGVFRVLYAGRLRTRKAVAVLVAAFAELHRRHRASELVLAGDGEQRPALEAQCRALGVAEAVRFLGALPPAAVAAERARADVFCLPSLYEGMPLAILEAMGDGLPVVATAVSGNPEALGEAGVLVPPADVGALAAALARLAADPALRRELGEAARRRVAERFAIGRVSGEYLALWRALLADVPTTAEAA